MRDIAFTLLFLGLLGYAYRRPWAALLIWAWLSYMNPHRLCYGFAESSVPFTMIAAIVTFASLFMERNNFPWTRETILLLVFCFWMVVTTYFALNQGQYAAAGQLSNAAINQGLGGAWNYLDRVIKIQAMIFATFYVMKSRFRLDALVWVIALSIGFWGLKGGIWTLVTGGGGHVMGPRSSMIEGNNELALALVMVLPFMTYLKLQTPSKTIRFSLTAMQFLCSVAVIGTYSRAGVLALCVMGTFQWWKSRHKLVLTLLLLLVGPPVVTMMPHEWLERMKTIKTTNEDQLDGSAKGRLNAWRMGLNLVRHRPVTGGGFKTFIRPIFAQYAPDPIDQHDAHSIYIETLAEQGVPGFSMFVTLGLFTWFTGRRVVKAAKRLPELKWASDLVSHTLLGLIGYAVGGAFAGLAYWDLPYHMMSIVVICGVLAREAIRNAARAKATASLAEAEPVWAVQEA